MSRKLITTTLAAVLALAGGVRGDSRELGEDASKKVATLLDAVRRGQEDRAIRCAEAVVACGVDAVEPLLADLASRSPVEIVMSLRCLVQIPDERARAPVMELVRHEDPAVRAEALACAVELFPKEVESLLVDAARDPELPVRRCAYDGIVALAPHNAGVLEIAFRGVVDGDFWILFRSLDLIGRWPLPEKGRDPVFARSLEIVGNLEGDAAIRLFKTLARRSVTRLPTVLERALGRGSPSARAAAYAVARDLRLFQFLTSARKDALVSRKPAVQKAAVRYLTALKDREAIPILVDLLDDVTDKSFREIVAVSLRNITGQPFGYDVTRWRTYLREQDLY